MSSTNQSPAYLRAQGKFLSARTIEEKLNALDEMIKECPKHKSSENMLANLRTRRKKLLLQQEKAKKTGKSKSKQGIKKSDMQAVIIGETNTGKSSLLKILTNTNPLIADYNFTTKKPEQGMANINGTQIQLIENPAVSSEYYDSGISHTADTILFLITSLNQLNYLEKIISPAKKIILFNNKDNLSENGLRKIQATLKSKYKNYPSIIINTQTQENLEELKEKLFQSFNKMRIYTKEPGKEKSTKPIISNPGAKVKDVAEKILKGFSKNVKETKIYGPSAKFLGQKVGLKHELKDLDVVEFKTR